MWWRSSISIPDRLRRLWPLGGVLVGGAARDLWRGVEPHDYDWAVPDPALAALRLAQQLGGSAFALDAERGYWRVHLPESGGGVQHDFVPLPARLEDDLRRRDFTVNALALDAQGQLTDPTGGQDDLKARRLRMVSADNLYADPLRAWRAARFEVTLGFRLDPATEQTVREVVAALKATEVPQPAPERVRDEMHTLLAHPDAAQGIQRLDTLGLLALTIPELREGLGLAQGGFHHLDVFGHNMEALHRLLERFPDAPLPLRWATLLHDVGKPRAWAASNRQNFYGHDRLGASMTREVLERLRLPAADIAHASALVAAHMVPLPAGEREARRFVHRRRPLLPDLLALMLADREAARGPHSTPASLQAYAQAIDRVLAALEEQPAPPPPLLGGRQIMALLNLPPGPQVGAAARALAEAHALGDVATPEEACQFLHQWAAAHSLPPSHESTT